MSFRLARRLRNHDWVEAFIDLVIVVAGILIALQVSNWNQDRFDARRKVAYVDRMLADLDTDLNVNANRGHFLVQVRRYGEQAIAHAAATAKRNANSRNRRQGSARQIRGQLHSSAAG